MSAISTISFDITGVEEIQKILTEVAPKNALKLITNTNYAIVARVRDETRPFVPRITGDLVKSVSVRNLSGRKEKPISVLYFKDPGFYWRFVEYGTIFQPERPFLTPAVNSVRAKLRQIVDESFVKVFDKLMQAELKKQAKMARFKK